MGDVLSLIERAEQAIDVEEAQKLEEKVRKDEFTLEDFREQLQAIKKMGPLEQIIGMIPGMGNIKQLAQQKPDDAQIGRIEAIISSMTPQERRRSDIINGSRRKRIARGSGTSVEEVNRLLKQFVQMRKMLKVDGRSDQRETRSKGSREAGFVNGKDEVGNVSDSNEKDGLEEAAVLPRGRHRFAHGARQQLRGDRGALQPSHEARESRNRPRTDRRTGSARARRCPTPFARFSSGTRPSPPPRLKPRTGSATA